MNMLDGLANSIYLQEEVDVSGDGPKMLIEEKFIRLYDSIRIFILDKDDLVTISLASRRLDIFVGADYSFSDWIIETRTS
ncbi:MAG TPA: hypothetical protein VE818_08155 [Nitrososphaeraceae archaeon]|nr:hypothetical protein [Nitrososphaeraceae archaeon]